MVEEHRELLAALQSRDPELMLRVLDRHIAVPSPPPVAAAPQAPRLADAARESGRP